jgi:hypothetical protein
VFLGIWRLQKVAVKQLRENLTEKQQHEFNEEAKLLMKLPHHKVCLRLECCA